MRGGDSPGRARGPDMEKLTQQQVDAALSDAEGWQQRDETISKTYRFHDFAGSIDFVNAIAEAAEAMGHHPAIDVRYNKVTLTLATHEVGGVTSADVALAVEADRRAH